MRADSPLPLSASFSPSVRRKDRREISKRPPRSDRVVPAAPPQLLLPGEVRRGPGQVVGSWGAGREAAPPELPRAFKGGETRRGRSRVGCVKGSASPSIGGWRPTLRRGTVAGHRAWPRAATSPPSPRLLALPRFQRLRPQGRGLGPPQHSAPTPALTATVSGLWARNLLCTRDLSGYPQNQREAQN